LDDTVAWLAAWLADEALPAVHIAGHSLGAAVAARMAARHPDRVQRLILVSAAIRPRNVRARMLSGGVVRLVAQRPSESYVPLFARDLLRSHPVSSIAASLDALQRDWEDDLARIVAPTLVVWGERDPITPISLAHGIAATIPDARLLTLPDTGHSPMWEEPDVFNEAVLDFLERSPVRVG
jgi:pimeloyl-ACP methyl ester carboxylesterase